MLELWHKLRHYIQTRREGDGLDEEIQFHLEQKTRRLAESGSGDPAREARKSFGNPTRIAEQSREAWSVAPLADLFRDLRIAFRSLRRKPVFAAAAILSLAIALGANTAVFSFARAIVMKRLAVPGSERLVILRQNNEQFHMENCCFTYRFFQELRRSETGFEDLLAVSNQEVALTDSGQTEKLRAALVSGNYFRMLGVRAALGRLLDDTDDGPETPRVCVIGYRLWRERFGGDTGILSRSVTVDGDSVQIVGVAEPGFDGATLYRPDEIFLPSAAISRQTGVGRDQAAWAMILGRLKPGTSPEQALAKLNPAGLALQRAAGFRVSDRDVFVLQDGSQGFGSRKRQYAKPVMLVFGLVVLVLLIASTNLAALTLVRNSERTAEAGVRAALGGSRFRLMRHFLAESLVLAAAGAAGGLVLAGLMRQALLNLLGREGGGMSRHMETDSVVIGFTALAAALAAAIFGLIPAWRTSGQSPIRSIRGISAAGPGHRSLAARVLIAAQIALSLAMMLAAGLFARSLYNLRSIDLGFSPENLVMISTDPTSASMGERGAPAFYRELLARAREVPGVRSASLASMSVLSGSMQRIVVRIPGANNSSGEMPVANFMSVSDGYLRTLGIPLQAGRDFTPADHDVAIVNQVFARRFFQGDALGRDFAYGGGRRVRIIGVAGTAHFQRLREEPLPMMYLPAKLDGALELHVRTQGSPAAVIGPLRSLIGAIGPGVPIERITTMEMLINEALSRERMLAFLSVLIGGMAVLLAAIGLYGVMAFSIVSRTREIGIRLAIGAERRDIVGFFLREALALVAIGVAAGIPLAISAGALAESLLYGLTPRDPATLAAALAFLLAASGTAALIPAWRASRLDPLRALRWE